MTDHSRTAPPEAAALPVVAWRIKHPSEPGMIGHYPWSYSERATQRVLGYDAEALTPHAPAQATIRAQAAEIERLKLLVIQGERGRAQAARAEHVYREAEKLLTLNERDLHAEIAALKAKQVAEADEVMRLADAMADAAAWAGYYRDDSSTKKEFSTKLVAAREALRAALTKDRT